MQGVRLRDVAPSSHIGTVKPKKEPTLASPTLGERMRAAYLAKGLNRSQFVRALGVSYPTAMRWESNQTAPSLDELHAISAITGVPVAVLLQDGGPMTGPQYESWAKFLKSPQGKAATAEERQILGSVHFPGRPPTVAVYMAMLVALRTAR